MNKKNLPNIPIYIGDWERDCNILSLESEMAWMKIIFKMHLLGKQSLYKTSTKGLQILWKSSPEKVAEILDELRFNDICEIVDIPGGYEFLCRRLKKENEISEVRSDAVKTRYKPKNDSTKPLQSSYKTLQNTDIDYDNEVDYEDVSKKVKALKGEKLKLNMPFDTETFNAQWQLWKTYKKDEHGFKYKSVQSEQAALTELKDLSAGEEKRAIAIINQSITNSWKGLFLIKSKTNGTVTPQPTYTRNRPD